MNKDSILKTLGVSIAMIIGILGLVYKFEFTIMYLADSIFCTGLVVFFIGIIFITGANKIFESTKYTTKKIFTRDDTKGFKTFGEYKEYKDLSSSKKTKEYKGMSSVVLGSIYIVIGLVLSFM